MEHHYYKRQGFTLAEVLITLGIIGVVAVLTLTTVIPEIQNKQNIAKWKKEYSVINTAFNEVLADNVQICEAYNNSGNCAHPQNYLIANYSSDFLDSMQKTLRVVDYCGNDDSYPTSRRCDNYNYYYSEYFQNRVKYKWSGIADIYSRYKALGVNSIINQNSYTPYGINAYNFCRRAFLLADGAAVYFGELWGAPWIVVDVNNFQKGPNEFGRDVFIINISSNIKKDRHYMSPAGSVAIYDFRPELNNSSYGIAGCSKDIGVQSSNTIYSVAGAGCSAKYLLE